MLNTKMLAVMDDVNTQVAERGELIEAIAVALLTRKNLFILGDTGQAKSFVINEFRRRITGAKQFERLLSKQADEEQLFGRIDLSSLIPGSVPQDVLAQDSVYTAGITELNDLHKKYLESGGMDVLNNMNACAEELADLRKVLATLHQSKPKMVTDGKIPDSHIVFLDECFKANDGILNSLLTALNERRFTNEGSTIDIPVISFFAASNEIPNFNNAEEKILKPLYDRLELKLVTGYVQDKTARLAVLKGKQRGRTGQIQNTITLDELFAMQSEVESVEVPDGINELMDEILCELRDKGIHVSDRKYFGFYPITQALAWLKGRDVVEASDLLILRHYLWTQPEERTVITELLTRKCINPLKEKLDDIIKMGLEAYADFEGADTAVSNVKRIGKLRNEYLTLYKTIMEFQGKAQSGSETVQIDNTLCQLEDYSKKAHDAVKLTYAPLSELYELSKTA